MLLRNMISAITIGGIYFISNFSKNMNTMYAQQLYKNAKSKFIRKLRSKYEFISLLKQTGKLTRIYILELRGKYWKI